MSAKSNGEFASLIHAYSFSTLRQKFKHLSSEGHNLLSNLLMYDPKRRISAAEAQEHPYFSYVRSCQSVKSFSLMPSIRENPLPKHPDLFPSFPSQAAGERCVIIHVMSTPSIVH